MVFKDFPQNPQDLMATQMAVEQGAGMTETHTAENDAPIANPPERVWWWDYAYESPSFDPVPGTVMPCGCHIRTPDYDAVLCPEHLSELNGQTRVIPPGSAHAE